MGWLAVSLEEATWFEHDGYSLTRKSEIGSSARSSYAVIMGAGESKSPVFRVRAK